MTPCGDPAAASRFLALATAPSRPRIDTPVVVVVAHPDDESLACGALLPRLGDVAVIHVTDGAPRNGGYACRHGFADPPAYAAARRREVQAALAVAGVGPDRAICLDVPDQAAAPEIAGIARQLVPRLAGAGIVLTHALEGGHPDHDAVAVAVRAACRLAGPNAPTVVEMPFYRAGQAGEGWIRQSFSDAAGVAVLRLTPDERRRKQLMLDAHASQADTLRSFGAADEPFRPAAPAERARLLGGTVALYDSQPWGVTSAAFQAAAEAALRALGLPDPWL